MACTVRDRAKEVGCYKGHVHYQVRRERDLEKEDRGREREREGQTKLSFGPLCVLKCCNLSPKKRQSYFLCRLPMTIQHFWILGASLVPWWNSLKKLPLLQMVGSPNNESLDLPVNSQPACCAILLPTYNEYRSIKFFIPTPCWSDYKAEGDLTN